MSIGVDLSLRSTGVVTLDDDLNLIDFILINPSTKEYNDEKLLTYIANEIVSYVNCNLDEKFGLDRDYAIEGLSFMSVSASKDIMYGNFWHLRCEIMNFTEDATITIYPVTKWRNGQFDKATLKEWKTTVKNGLKELIVNKTPENVKIKFLEYIKEKKLHKNSIYDLCDAYWLCRYHILTKLGKEITKI